MQNHTTKSLNRSIVTKATPYRSLEPPVPSYKSHVVTTRNLLTEDEQELRYFHYFGESDNEDTAAMNDHFENRVSDMVEKSQRREGVEQLDFPVTGFLSLIGSSMTDILYYHIGNITSWQKSASPFHTNLSTTAREVVQIDDAQRQALLESLPVPDSAHITLSARACKAFIDATDLELWHVVRYQAEKKGLLAPEKPVQSSQGTQGASLETYSSLGCLVCKMNECPEHGKYDGKNHRRRIVTANAISTTSSSTGTDTRGAQTDVEVVASREDYTRPVPTDNELEDVVDCRHASKSCGDWCFLAKDNLTKSPQSIWSDMETEILVSTLPAYRHLENAACLFTSVIEKPCFEIYIKIQSIDPGNSRDGRILGNLAAPVGAAKVKRHARTDWADTLTHRHDKRNALKPCNHAGPCIRGRCYCVDHDIACEKYCNCSTACTWRYRGCSCTRSGKPCRIERCDCVRLNRECDPDLCSTCGASELLDPVNRGGFSSSLPVCSNVNLQLGIPKHTFLGTSEVDGYGLFMGEQTRARDFLGEYTGEIISRREGNRRGVIYHELRLSYLFNLNAKQDVDATRAGNKLRFINHAKEGKNCDPKVLLVNGVQRIAMFTTRDLAPGEEIFFDYGPEYTKKFVSKAVHDSSSGVETAPKRSTKQPKQAQASATGATHAQKSKHPATSTASPNGFADAGAASRLAQRSGRAGAMTTAMTTKKRKKKGASLSALSKVQSRSKGLRTGATAETVDSDEEMPDAITDADETGYSVNNSSRSKSSSSSSSDNFVPEEPSPPPVRRSNRWL
ncbi:MAG: hypothetical protein M1825_005156 [Sarcosagium campestre]|nr:MAG: hypothetical protein M1825_005156 [Sarcosagium campestre]